MTTPDRFPTAPSFDRHGEIRLMVRSGGYCMCRRKGAMPFVMTEKGWKKLSPTPLPTPTPAEGA